MLRLGPYLRTSTVVSATGHVLLVLVAQFGLPFLTEPPPVTANLVAVDVVNIDDVTRPPKPATPEPDPAPEPPVSAPPPPPQAAPEPPTPAPPKQAEAKPEPKREPPKPVEKKPEPKPEPPREVAEVPEPAPAPEPPKQAEAEPEPKAEPAPQLAEAKPQAKPKAPAPADSRDFNSLLKDLTERKEAPRAEEQARRPKAPSEEGKEAPKQANVSDRATIAERDRLAQLIRDRVQPCWNPPAGARDANDLVVTLHINVDQQGFVRNVRIEDAPRMATNQYFRAAADSARRAVLNPRCQPLELPAGQYEVWKDIKFNFDPREMLG